MHAAPRAASAKHAITAGAARPSIAVVYRAVTARSSRTTRRAFLRSIASAGVVGSRAHAGARSPQDRLPNGIVRANPWPPPNLSFATDPERPPYLADPPAIIPIDTGRQLFVDDFLIEETSLARVHHAAEYHPASPVLVPERPYERADPYAALTQTPVSEAAMPFSDGVFFDPSDRLFKMWYMGGYQQYTCLATSHDGVAWHRPALDIVGGTNIVDLGSRRDSSTVWLDLRTRDEASRYKMSQYDLDAKNIRLGISNDGVHWRDLGVAGPAGDRSTFYYDPLNETWVFSLRDEAPPWGRYRRFAAARHFESASWRRHATVPWTGADRLDPPRPDYRVPTELYNLDAVGYESLLLGLFTWYRGERPGREKPNDVGVGFSRDGFHWTRPNRAPFIAVSEDPQAWNWGNVQSAGGCCLIVNDRLHFYVSARSGVPGTSAPGVCSTGLATLRRDGFASLTDRENAARPRPVPRHRSAITTRPVRFSGRFLFVNARVTGALIAEVLDRAGRPIERWSSRHAVPFRGDSTRAPLGWTGNSTLEALAGEVVRFRFTLTEGELYSFWVSSSPRGESRGYTAAGGPGLSGAEDA